MPEYDFSDFGGIADAPPPGATPAGGAAPPGAPPSKKGEGRGGAIKKLIPMLLPGVMGLVGALVGAGAMVFMGGGGESAAPAAPAPEGGEAPAAVEEVVPLPPPPPPPQRQNALQVYDLPPFTINLRGGGGGRVLRLTMSLQVDAGYVETLNQQSAEVRDAVNILVSDYTWAELEGLDGKNRLRDELLGRLNSVFAGQIQVERIYFTEFVVQ